MKPRSDDYEQREAATSEPKHISKLIHYNLLAKNQSNDQKKTEYQIKISDQDGQMIYSVHY